MCPTPVKKGSLYNFIGNFTTKQGDGTYTLYSVCSCIEKLSKNFFVQCFYCPTERMKTKPEEIDIKKLEKLSENNLLYKDNSGVVSYHNAEVLGLYCNNNYFFQVANLYQQQKIEDYNNRYESLLKIYKKMVNAVLLLPCSIQQKFISKLLGVGGFLLPKKITSESEFSNLHVDALNNKQRIEGTDMFLADSRNGGLRMDTHIYGMIKVLIDDYHCIPSICDIVAFALHDLGKCGDNHIEMMTKDKMNNGVYHIFETYAMIEALGIKKEYKEIKSWIKHSHRVSEDELNRYAEKQKDSQILLCKSQIEWIERIINELFKKFGYKDTFSFKKKIKENQTIIVTDALIGDYISLPRIKNERLCYCDARSRDCKYTNTRLEDLHPIKQPSLFDFIDETTDL